VEDCVGAILERAGETLNVVYFGLDFCYRKVILERDGFDVEECSSLNELVNALKAQPALVIMGCIPLDAMRCAIAVVRGLSHAPIAMFGDILERRDADIDLAIDTGCGPEEWLRALRDLLSAMPSAGEGSPGIFPMKKPVFKEDSLREAQTRRAK
jgi:hypothetical protein